MSNYSPIVLYGAKDSLAHGDPNKAIKGAQLDSELAAIASAISTKMDSAGGGILQIGRTKTSTTTKTSSTTLAIDPHLQYNVPGAGAYTFSIFIAITSGGGGFHGSVQYSGSNDVSLSYESHYGYMNSTFFSGPVAAIPGSSYASSVTTSADYMMHTGTLIATGAGTFGLWWAQSSSSASPLTVQAGYLLMTKVS